MLKIFHTSDVHLGAKFVSLGERAETHREQLRKTFRKLVEEAVADKANTFLVSGDLFDSPYPSGLNIDFAKEMLGELASNGIEVFVLPGTHDCLAPGSVWMQEYWDEIGKLHVFRDPSGGYFFAQELGLLVCGYPLPSGKGRANPVKEVSATLIKANTEFPDASCKVGMVHGSLAIRGKSAPDDFLFSKEDIEASGFDYIAIGHWHSSMDCETKKVKAWYAGAPEAIGVDQKGSGGYLVVSVDDGAVRVARKQIGLCSFDRLTIDVGRFKDRDEVLRAISKGADKNLIRTVELNGMAPAGWNLDYKELELLLRDRFHSLRIESKISLSVDQIDEKQYSNHLALGRFVGLMKAEIAKETSPEQKRILEEALGMGVSILSNVPG